MSVNNNDNFVTVSWVSEPVDPVTEFKCDHSYDLNTILLTARPLVECSKCGDRKQVIEHEPFVEPARICMNHRHFKGVIGATVKGWICCGYDEDKYIDNNVTCKEEYLSMIHGHTDGGVKVGMELYLSMVGKRREKYYEDMVQV
jgi:hypothetical protein